MAYNRYQYETSPRKLQPEYRPIEKKYPKKSTAKRSQTKTKQSAKKAAKTNNSAKAKLKTIAYVSIAFAILFVISYRNSVIDENFKKVQSLKTELATIEKENEQLKVNIESSLNLKNIEEAAKVNLGMQKLDSSKTKYINLPREDYVEPATEEVIIEEESNWFQEILNYIGEIFN